MSSRLVPIHFSALYKGMLFGAGIPKVGFCFCVRVQRSAGFGVVVVGLCVGEGCSACLGCTQDAVLRLDEPESFNVRRRER